MDETGGAPLYETLRQFGIGGALAKIDAAGNRPAKLLLVAIRALAEARDQVRPEVNPGPDEFRRFIYELTTAYFAIGQILGVERDVMMGTFGMTSPASAGRTAGTAPRNAAAASTRAEAAQGGN